LKLKKDRRKKRNEKLKKKRIRIKMQRKKNKKKWMISLRNNLKHRESTGKNMIKSWWNSLENMKIKRRKSFLMKRKFNLKLKRQKKRRWMEKNLMKRMKKMLMIFWIM
jgi:hypothetical protein